MGISDFRRGDADDDRLSPHGRGLRAIVLSALFELNIIQATVAAVFLILLPAFLVGLAPSVLRTYKSAVFGAVSQAQDHPYLVVLALLLLGAAAYWFGPAIFRGMLRNLWHLHYTLIFPIFIFGREVVKVAAEKWAGAVSSPLKLYRRRVIGTIAAGLFFAGGALLIALALFRAYGFQSVSLITVNVREVFWTALVNGVEILAISTVALSLYWSWRELSLGAPAIDWTSSAAVRDGDRRRLHIAHLSDPHLVSERYGFRMESGTSGPCGNDRWRAALQRLVELDTAERFDWIFITGDITDAGRRAEWAEFADSLAPYPRLRERMLIVPGNHDVNVADRENPAKLETPLSVSMALRKLRYIGAADWLQGDRVHVFDRKAGKIGPTLHDYLRAEKRLEHLEALARHGSLYEAWRTARLWPELFPMIVPPGADGRPGLVLINSCTNSHTALTNAIGAVEPEELRALRKILRSASGSAWLILLHHQVVEYPILGISLQERVALALTNAPELMAAIGDQARHAAIFHGHRHRDWMGSCGELALCSAGSAVLGAHDDDAEQGIFHVRDVEIDGEGNVTVTRSERIHVVDTSAPAEQVPAAEARSTVAG